MATAFATCVDVQALADKTYTIEEEARVALILDMISDALRVEAKKVGKDLDAMVEADPAYKNLVKLTVIDIVIRALRSSQTGEPMTQESQGALGYTWSGTYAIPGGGFAGAIMRNDLKRLGLRKQRYGVMELWEADCTG